MIFFKYLFGSFDILKNRQNVEKNLKNSGIFGNSRGVTLNHVIINHIPLHRGFFLSHLHFTQIFLQIKGEVGHP
jgi:hypothetical protein